VPFECPPYTDPLAESVAPSTAMPFLGEVEVKCLPGNQPTPQTLQPAPYTLHPIPYTLHPTPYTPQPTPYTLHLTPFTPYTRHAFAASVAPSTAMPLLGEVAVECLPGNPTPKHYTLHPAPCNLSSQPSTPNPQPPTLNPETSLLGPKLSTLNPKP